MRVLDKTKKIYGILAIKNLNEYSTHIKFSNKNARFVISEPIGTKLPDYSSHVQIIDYLH
jgi:hypothetical protein